MTYAPIARIAIRYGVGAVIGMAQAEQLAADPDIVTTVAMAIGAAVEAAYVFAKKKGWAT
jgi:predicted DNA-binding protein with PD1-like motif